MEQKLEQLYTIYEIFQNEAVAYKNDAACRKGCAYCCTDAGSIDITTLQGLAVRSEILRLPRNLQVKLKKDLNKSGPKLSYL